MLWRKLFSFAIAGFLLVILPIACFSPATKTPEIPIGLIVPLTGEVSELAGGDSVRGAELAVKEINDTGGLKVGDRQQKVKLLIEDDRDLPDVAIAAARKLIYHDEVVALVGLPLSRIAIPVAKIAEESHIPTISSWSSNPETTAGKKYVFRVVYTDDFVGKTIARWAHHELNFKKAAVLYDIASEYNRGLAEFFQQEFEKIGGEIVAFESFTTNETDFTAQLDRIRNSPAKVLFLPNYTTEVSRQIEQIQEMGIQIELLGCEAWSSLPARDRLHLEGAFFTDLWSPELEDVKTQQFIQDYRLAYGEIPRTVAALTYDAMGLLFQAIESQGKIDSESIRQGLANTKHYHGVSGKMFYPDNGDPQRSILMMQFKEGQATVYKIIEPDSIP
ncbi:MULTISPECIES: ABC transporter substrate-binding protein [Spirulina sp. CCY15215]|uniref:ABC transporter substrate-binding protein n=1 Tax=Spirulina sp. CCY15215 TaxID=2767591 RepID=UPI00194FAEA3|nr:ABC transporter substrate-binding protein [Spirulina major]